jgi:predicted  nucleic acid-binding Zn-ribbon protein
MKEAILRGWPVVLALSAVTAGSAMFISWIRWGGYESRAVLAAHGGEPGRRPTVDRETVSFLSSLATPDHGSPRESGSQNPPTKFQLSLESPRVIITASSRAADSAIRGANRRAETAVSRWNSRARERERARLDSLNAAEKELTAELAALRDEEARFRVDHPGVGPSEASRAPAPELQRLARDLAETEHTLAYLEGRRDRLQQELRLLDTESDEEYLARTDPAVSVAATRLRELRRELHDLRRRYTEKNPLVVSTLQRVEEGEEVYGKALEAARESPDTLEPPRERVLRSELAAVEREMEEANGEIEGLRAEIESAEERVRALPVLEKQLEEFRHRESRITQALSTLREEREKLVALAGSGTGFLPRLRVETPAATARIAARGRIAVSGILGGGAGLLLGFGFVGARGRGRLRRESAEQLAARLGVPVLAAYPPRE